MTMDDLLFRGKRLDNGQWIKGSLVRLHDGRCMIFEPCGWQMFPVDPKTVGQYIGREDETGQRIFADDIVKAVYFSSRNGKAVKHTLTGKVEYECGLCAFIIVGQNGVWEAIGTILIEFEDSTLTKLGNIHDNPELIENFEQLEEDG